MEFDDVKAKLNDPLTLPSPPRGRGFSKSGVIGLVALAAMLFATSPASAQQAYSVSIKPPTEIGADERVAGFWIDLTGASIRGVPAIPPGWVVNIDNLLGHVSIQGTLQEGATSLDPSFFRDFLVVEEMRRPAQMFDISGELIMTSNLGDDTYDGRHVPLIGEQFALKPVPSIDSH